MQRVGPPDIIHRLRKNNPNGHHCVFNHTFIPVSCSQPYKVSFSSCQPSVGNLPYHSAPFNYKLPVTYHSLCLHFVYVVIMKSSIIILSTVKRFIIFFTAHITFSFCCNKQFIYDGANDEATSNVIVVYHLYQFEKF